MALAIPEPPAASDLTIPELAAQAARFDALACKLLDAGQDDAPEVAELIEISDGFTIAAFGRKPETLDDYRALRALAQQEIEQGPLVALEPLFVGLDLSTRSGCGPESIGQVLGRLMPKIAARVQPAPKRGVPAV